MESESLHAREFAMDLEHDPAALDFLWRRRGVSVDVAVTWGVGSPSPSAGQRRRDHRRDVDISNSFNRTAASAEERDLIIAASNAWCPAFDNLSSLPNWLSDSFCRLATGGGFGGRELYTDDEEKLFDATRPIIINGIEELATRPDLLERSLCLMLPTLDETQRRTEAEIWQAFDGARPRVLGALLDAVCMALRELPNVKLSRLPRMADLAKWITAGETALGLTTGAFMAAYMSNREQSDELAIVASRFATSLREFATAKSFLQGTAKDLGNELAKLAGEASKSKEWPQSPRAVSGALRRIAPSLRRVGVQVTLPSDDTRAGKGRNRIITLESTSISPSTPSASSATQGESAADARLDELADESDL